MSIKRKAGIAMLLVTAVTTAITAALLFTGRVDMGQATESQVKKTLEVQPVTGASSPVFYTVQKGDCLWSVAEKFDVDVDLLAYTNDMNAEDLLLENSEIVIPYGNKVVYTVAPGDTLWSLAKKFNTTVEVLAGENGENILELLPADREITVPIDVNAFYSGESVAEENRNRSNSQDKNSAVLSNINIPQLSSWPVEGVVSSAFGRRWGRMHEGIDIAADNGEPITAVEDGVVAFSGDRGTYGYTIIINHGNGFRSQYAHASKLLVTVGERVEKGQVIARVGNTGRSTGPHLHFELLYKGQPFDPEKYLPDKL